MLGGHVDPAVATPVEVLAQYKAGNVRILGVADIQENELFSGVPTMQSQGFDVRMVSSHIISGPAGILGEVVEVLSSAIKKVLGSEEIYEECNHVQTAYPDYRSLPQSG